ncbi:hypothetical protein BC833DRAFT_594404 [Globomyces pollinis-pini]|nr:hypothetical protein BC833DRAFT_594404 [Globomyces pollinis-pini]
MSNIRDSRVANSLDQDFSSDLELAILLHERNQLLDSFKCLEIAYKNGEPLAIYLYCIHLREGIGCKPNQPLAFQSLLNGIYQLNNQIVNQSDTVELHNQNVNQSVKSVQTDQIDLHDVDVKTKTDEKLQRQQQLIQLKTRITCVFIISLLTYEVGVCYMNNWGINKNKKSGIYYISIAASLGLDKALEHMGHLWYKGNGVKRSLLMAAKNYRLAYKDKRHSPMGMTWIWDTKYDMQSDGKVYDHYHQIYPKYNHRHIPFEKRDKRCFWCRD